MYSGGSDLLVLLLPELLVELVLATDTKLSARDERLVFRVGRGGGTFLLGGKAGGVVVAEGVVVVVEALLGRGGRLGREGGIGPFGPLRATWSSCNMAILSLMLVPVSID